VVPACGIHQVSDPDRFLREGITAGPIAQFLQDRIVEVSSAYLAGVEPDGPEFLDLADPVRFLEKKLTPERPLPPFFAPVGSWDPLKVDTMRLKAALDALGVECAAPVYRGHHAFHAFVVAKEARRCWADTFEFLERVVPAA